MSASGIAPTAAPHPPEIHLSKEPETLFIPLYARALDYRRRRSILHDAKADEIVRSVDYDFSRYRSVSRASFLAARARHFDDWTREFLRGEPAALVLNLGCGLDARQRRVGPGPSVEWFDVDLPEVIELRRRYFAERPGYRMLAASITSPVWLEACPNDRPLVAVADGVLMYLPEGDVRTLLRRLADRFPRGVVMFDVANRRVAQRANVALAATGATVKWAVDDLRAVDRIDERFGRTATVPLFRSPYLPRTLRLAFALVGAVSPSSRDAFRLLRYELGRRRPEL